MWLGLVTNYMITCAVTLHCTVCCSGDWLDLALAKNRVKAMLFQGSEYHCASSLSGAARHRRDMTKIGRHLVLASVHVYLIGVREVKALFLGASSGSMILLAWRNQTGIILFTIGFFLRTPRSFPAPCANKSLTTLKWALEVHRIYFRNVFPCGRRFVGFIKITSIIK